MTSVDYLEVARLHSVWRNMKARCYNEKNISYKVYGQRGIFVSAEWHDFNTFCQWALDAGSAKGLDLDRIDNDGPYAPWNCRWVTRAENALNRSDNHRISAWGETKTLKEWSGDRRCVVPVHTLTARINKLGWMPEDAIAIKDRKHRVRRCRQGHLLIAENLYIRGNGMRMCKECTKKQARDAYWKNKDK